MAFFACSGSDGVDGIDGVAGANGENGKDGHDGVSCTMTPLKDSTGFKVVCGGDSVGVIINGQNGTNGNDGEDGSNGENGKSCTVKAVTNEESGRQGAEISCEDGSKQVLWNGLDGDPGLDGSQGPKGSDGVSMVICGAAEYNPAEQFCYGITLYNLCDKAAYEPATHFCSSDNKVLEKCDGEPYDIAKELCDEALGKVITAKKCNGVLYNPRLQVCDNDELTDLASCDTEQYNIGTQFCHENQVYDLCGLESYDPDEKECVNGTIEDAYNIVYGLEKKAKLTSDELYVVDKNGDTIAVDMGITSEKGNKLYIATGNLIVTQGGFAYISKDPGYIPNDRWYKAGGGEWDLFGWADTSGRKTSTSLSDYPGSAPPTNISGRVEYDIAKYKLGGNWRLPTGDELKNLIDGNNGEISSVTHTKTNPGRLWKNSELGTELFIPFAGNRNGATLYDVGSRGFVWSGSLNTSYTDFAYRLDFYASGTVWNYNYRYTGRSVRPVLEFTSLPCFF